jgi:hypothetical protein
MTVAVVLGRDDTHWLEVLIKANKRGAHKL